MHRLRRHAPKTPLGHFDPHLLVGSADETAAALRERARQTPTSDWILACVVDTGGHLVGALTLAELLVLPETALLGDACRRDVERVVTGTDEEHVASIALDRGAMALPVVDDAGRLVGVVGPKRLMHILRREHVEDLHRLAGITREESMARHAIEDPPMRRARHRLPWLLVGLFGSALATLVMSRFEATLAALPAIAFFVPGLVYLADAIGTQSEAVAVRGLSLSHARIGTLIGGELRTGLLLGAVLAAVAFPLTWWVFDQQALAMAVALALAGASAAASMLGLLLPWLLHRLDIDPAYGSGPLATIIQDVLTLLVYFGSVSWLVL